MKKYNVIKDNEIKQATDDISKVKKYLDCRGIYMLAHAGQGMYVRIPYKTFRDLCSIKKIHFKIRLKEYLPDDDEYITHGYIDRTFDEPMSIYKFLRERTVKESVLNDEIIPFLSLEMQYMYKKVKIVYKDGTTEKLSMNKLYKRYFRGLRLR